MRHTWLDMLGWTWPIATQMPKEKSTYYSA